MTTTGQPPCRICQTGQRISTATFAFFAVALMMAAADPDQTALKQTLMAACAFLSGVAVFRFPIARLVGSRMSRRRGAAAHRTDDLRKRMP